MQTGTFQHAHAQCCSKLREARQVADANDGAPAENRHNKNARSRDRAFFGAPSGTRTQDPLIKSQLLYQLS